VPIQLALRGALALVCVAAAVASVITYASVKRVDHAAYGFVASGDFPRVLRDLRASDSALNPSNYRDQGIAITLLHMGRRAAAERAMARAADAEPQNAFLWVVLTRIRVTRGRLAAARASWAHVRRLDPHLPARLPAPA
jgi:cytochrome c-type biogenesis protein CcmH/NrfG